MGLASSRIKPEDWNPRAPGHLPENVETLADYQKPIDSKDILHCKLSRYAARFCLREEIELHIESLFFAQISKPIGSEDAYWSENDLSRFCSIIPNSSFPNHPMSWSVLYKLLLRLGSFPYITEPAAYLTYDVFRLGLIMLSGQYIKFHASRVDLDHPDANEEALFIDRHYRRIVFQALAERNLNSKSSNGSEDRSDSDDEDLSEALNFLKLTQQWDGPNQCIGFSPAPLPTSGSLPSSLSTNLEGKIPWSEMKDLLETLLVLKTRGVHGTDINRNDFTSNSASDLRQAVDSTIQAGDNSVSNEAAKDINWSTFNSLLDTLPHKSLEALFIIANVFCVPRDKLGVEKSGGSSAIHNKF